MIQLSWHTLLGAVSLAVCSLQGFIILFSSVAHAGATSSHTLSQPVSSHQRRTALDGVAPVGPSPRIINGVESEPFRFPYMVVLNKGLILSCAGSLIAPDIVLTAAHCSESFDEVQVGRHNRSDEGERYESLIVEDIFTHPNYFRNYHLDADPYDFAVVKVFGQSRLGRPVKINADRDVPWPDQQLTVYGWGSTDASSMSGQSDVLLETNAYYIPNDVCRTFVGSFRDTAVDFEDVVTTATLCATDFENLTDSCRGDSGGGLIIKGETAQDDLLVGLVSQGYGCANPTLPALYARVSEVDSWIRDMVCEYSENPPLDFGCSHSDDTDDDDARSLAFPCEGLPVGRDTDGSTNTSGSSSTTTLQGVQYTPCTGLLPFTNITVKLRLDTRPEQRGWVMRGKDELGIWRTVAERPILHYSGIEPFSTVLDIISVRNNREYEIVLLDSYGDGQDFELASSMVLEIRDLNDQVLLSIDDFSGLDLYHSTFGFAVGVPATFAPTQSMTPSVTMTPTSSPTAIRPFISVVIQFGSIPQDIGFRLEIFEDSAETELFEGQNTEEYTLLHVVYPGNFAADLEASRIMLEIPLKPESSQKQTYQFTMISNEGFGVLSGGYEVWLGPALTGDFLFRGGDFSYEDAHIFFIDPKMPASEFPVPSPATAADAPILTSPIFFPDEAVGDHSVTPSSSSASSACFSACSYLLVAFLPFLVQS